MNKTVVFVIVIFCLISACVTKRKQVEVFKQNQDSVVLAKVSERIKTVNKPIDDKVFLSVPKTNNKEVDSLVKKLFTNFKTSKTSGTNSYGIAYDNQKNGFEIKAKMGETNSEVTKEKEKQKSSNKSVLQETRVTVRYRTPLKVYLFWFLSLIGFYLSVKFKIIRL